MLNMFSEFSKPFISFASHVPDCLKNEPFQESNYDMYCFF